MVDPHTSSFTSAKVVLFGLVGLGWAGWLDMVIDFYLHRSYDLPFYPILFSLLFVTFS